MTALDRGLLAHLERRKAEVPPPADLPPRLPLAAIVRHESLFQPRALDQGHVTALAGVLKSQDDLTPMLVIQIGNDAVLIDGHHRRAAYEAASASHPVPVEYFEGSVVEAIRQSGLANHQDKLPMTFAEKQDLAWKFVLLGRWSTAEEARSSGASRRTVNRMRAAKKVLGDQAFRFEKWTAADMAARDAGGGQEELSDEEVEDRLDEQAGLYVDRLNKHFGRKLAEPEMAARVLVRYVGMGVIPDLVTDLMERVGLTHRGMIKAALIEAGDDPDYEPESDEIDAAFLLKPDFS